MNRYYCSYTKDKHKEVNFVTSGRVIRIYNGSLSDHYEYYANDLRYAFLTIKQAINDNCDFNFKVIDC